MDYFTKDKEGFWQEIAEKMGVEITAEEIEETEARSEPEEQFDITPIRLY
jgi:hypothetical protein